MLSVTPSEGVSADTPLTGMKLLTVGKLRQNKDELKAAVEELLFASAP